jgi:hypothetical protein
MRKTGTDSGRITMKPADDERHSQRGLERSPIGRRLDNASQDQVG